MSPPHTHTHTHAHRGCELPWDPDSTWPLLAWLPPIPVPCLGSHLGQGQLTCRSQCSVRPSLSVIHLAEGISEQCRHREVSLVEGGEGVYLMY